MMGRWAGGDGWMDGWMGIYSTYSTGWIDGSVGVVCLLGCNALQGRERMKIRLGTAWAWLGEWVAWAVT